MLRKIFWRGLQATIPLALTLAITAWLTNSIESFFGFWLKKLIGDTLYFPGLGFLVGLALIFCVGIAINAWYVRAIHEWGERILKRIPGIKTLYASLSDLMGFFDPLNPQQRGRPVILTTPLGSLIGFVTVDSDDKLPPQLRDLGLIGVYIPLSYQIGGLTTFVPKDNVQELSLSVDQAMGFVLSAGMAGLKTEKK